MLEMVIKLEYRKQMFSQAILQNHYQNFIFKIKAAFTK